MRHPPSTLQPDPGGSAGTSAGPTFRSAAVARMAQMPVSTLRIWEQRYRAVQPATAVSGHRLYTAADVQRVLVLRQLTGQGHAIGSIAGLDAAQLRQLQAVQQATEQAALPVMSTATRDAPAMSTHTRRSPAPCRVAVAGPALALRLQRPDVARTWSTAARVVRVVAVFGSITEAAPAGAGRPADVLLCHVPELTPDTAAEICAMREDGGPSGPPGPRGPGQLAVVYRYAGSTALRALRDAGVAVIREPADDQALAEWVVSLGSLRALAGSDDRAAAPVEADPATDPTTAAPGSVAPRRYDDATLTALAGLSPTLACECPRHVAELLMQISSFETYSAACIHRNDADAALHAYLHQVAATSRALFETALERVARHEGLSLRAVR